MSTVDMDLFSPAPQDEQHPEFAKAFLGFDPHDVEEFVTQAEGRIALLERQLKDTQAQIEGAHRRATAAREEAYREVAGRMAELLRAGAVYYSDEYAVVDPWGRVHPFAKPLSIRDGSARGTSPRADAGFHPGVQRTRSSSTSKTSSAFGGMTPPAPRAP